MKLASRVQSETTVSELTHHHFFNMFAFELHILCLQSISLSKLSF